MPNRDLDLLFEVGALRRVPRLWIHFFGPGMANNAEHSFRVAWIAMIIARREKQGNMENILKMALLHNLDEGRTGDVNYLMRQYVKRDKVLAINDIVSGTSVKEELLDVWKEYEERKTIEVKIVKDADTLDVDMELKEMAYTGHKLPLMWASHRKEGPAKKLFTPTAKKLLQELERSDPHDWHHRGRNRANAGDWAKVISKTRKPARKKRS